MFKCENCQILSKLLQDVTDTNAKLHEELVSLVKSHLHKPVFFQSGDDAEYYGVDDEMVAYNEFGEKVIVKKQKDS